MKIGKMLSVRCKICNKELVSVSNKPVCCGCPNMVTIANDRITATDLSQVVYLNTNQEKKNINTLSAKDIEWQEKRSKRKIRKLDFETR
jgi:hypothetical protein